MIYFNQRDYGHIPYPAPGYEQATVKTSGCGPCCLAMLIANKFDKTYTVEQAVKLAKDSGARVSGGTDMETLSKAAERIFPLKYSRGTGMESMLSAMRYERAMCIVNVGKSGLFSSSGHYVLAADVGDVYITVLDPYLYAGKFAKPGRRGRVLVSQNCCYVRPEDLAQDAKGYYIFREEKNMTVDEAKAVVKAKAGLSDRTIDFLYHYRYGDALLEKLAAAMK